MLKAMEEKLPEGKDVFFLYTCGAMRKGYTAAAAAVAAKKNCRVLGEYGCKGFDTYGPFKLVGGIAKGHPDASDIDGAVKFYEDMLKQYTKRRGE